MKERASCCSHGAADWRPLNAGQRCARLVVGIVLLGFAQAVPWLGAGGVVLTVILSWVGASHVLAAVMSYPGCPELGAVASLLLGRWVRIGCTPWRWLDARLRLTAE
jgi:hypothetical protein